MRTVRSLAAAGTVALLLGLIVVTAGGSTASACSCASLTDEEAFAAADAVFTGALIDVEELSQASFSSIDPQRFVFEVDAVFKGAAGVRQTIVTAREGASCGLEITGSGPFAVFATNDDYITSGAGPGELYANLCGGTRPLAESALPAVFGQGRRPTQVIAETGADSETTTWLIPAAGALLVVGAVVAVWSRRRPIPPPSR